MLKKNTNVFGCGGGEGSRPTWKRHQSATEWRRHEKARGSSKCCCWGARLVLEFGLMKKLLYQSQPRTPPTPPSVCVCMSERGCASLCVAIKKKEIFINGAIVSFTCESAAFNQWKNCLDAPKLKLEWLTARDGRSKSLWTDVFRIWEKQIPTG